MPRPLLRRLACLPVAAILTAGLLIAAATPATASARIAPSQAANGCVPASGDGGAVPGTDSDCDGVNDDYDACTFDQGPVSNSGCARNGVRGDDPTLACNGLDNSEQSVNDVLRKGSEFFIACSHFGGKTVPIRMGVTLTVSSAVARALGSSKTIVDDRAATKGRTKKENGGQYTYWRVKLPAGLKAKLRAKHVRVLMGKTTLTITFAKIEGGGETQDPVLEYPPAKERGDTPHDFAWFPAMGYGDCKHAMRQIVYGC